MRRQCRSWVSASFVGGCLLLTAILGCSSREDAAFRASVVRVLQDAAELDKAIEDSYLLGADAPDSVANAFHREVVGLPPARSRELRYLAMRLQVLSEAAARRVQNQRFFAHVQMVYSVRLAGGTEEGRVEAQAAIKGALDEAVRTQGLFWDDYQVAGEAERVALGTNTLWDRLSSMLMTTPSDSGGVAVAKAGMDSVRKVRGGFVQRELGSFR